MDDLGEVESSVWRSVDCVGDDGVSTVMLGVCFHSLVLFWREALDILGYGAVSAYS